MNLSKRGALRAMGALAVVSLASGCAVMDWVGLGDSGGGKNTRVVVVEAESFIKEANGAALKRNDRPGTSGGMCFSGWDDSGHEIEWKLDVPQTGLYSVTTRYAGGRKWDVYRDLKINGKVPAAAFSKITWPFTGGWGSKPAEWVNLTVADAGKPVLIKLEKGSHKLTMTNLGGGSNPNGAGNLDMIAFIGADADAKAELAKLEAKFPTPEGMRK